MACNLQQCRFQVCFKKTGTECSFFETDVSLLAIVMIMFSTRKKTVWKVRAVIKYYALLLVDMYYECKYPIKGIGRFIRKVYEKHY